jgi:hypothetical protein
MGAGAFVVMAVGLFALVLPMPTLWRTQRARSYLPVPGRIIERSVVDAPSSFSQVTAGWGKYVLRVKYSYRVDGSEFTSDRFTFVPRRYGQKRAEAELAKLPDQPTVFVNPHDPADSVVDRRGAGTAIMTVCVGVIVVLCALASIYYQ